MLNALSMQCTIDTDDHHSASSTVKKVCACYDRMLGSIEINFAGAVQSLLLMVVVWPLSETSVVVGALIAIINRRPVSLAQAGSDPFLS